MHPRLIPLELINKMGSYSLILIIGLCGLAGAVSVHFNPTQVHISTGTSNNMTIVWSTLDDTKVTRVLYGLTFRSFNLVAIGTATKFVDGGAKKASQFIHTVELTGLAPDTVYYYMVGSDYGYSNVFAFKTWPTAPTWAPSLAIFGDMGNTDAHALGRLETDAAKGMYDAVLHVGDFAYNMDTNDASVGDEFMRKIEPLASSLPYMTCPGNHENAYNFSNYKARFNMPGDINHRMYYSFKMGPVRFISTVTEYIFYTNYGLVQPFEHYRWLENELADANKPENRAKQPWVITFGHRPMYCSNNDDDDCTKSESRVRTGIAGMLGWEKLFYQYGVDIAFWAHEHSYERLWPLYNFTVMNGSVAEPYTNPKAPVHIITGSAGCDEGDSPFVKNPADWSAFHSDDYGYTRMKVLNGTHIYMEYVSDDKGGAVIDKLMVIKDQHGAFTDHPKPNRPVDPVEFRTKWEKFLWMKPRKDLQ